MSSLEVGFSTPSLHHCEFTFTVLSGASYCTCTGRGKHVQLILPHCMYICTCKLRTPCWRSLFTVSYRASLTVRGLLLCTVLCNLCTPHPVHTTDHLHVSIIPAAILVISCLISVSLFPSSFLQYYCLDLYPFYTFLCQGKKGGTRSRHCTERIGKTGRWGARIVEGTR
jgi:hypothetical protein